MTLGSRVATQHEATEGSAPMGPVLRHGQRIGMEHDFTGW